MGNYAYNYNFITFFEVLEHQDRPKDFLRVAKALLKPSGWIAGSIPNGRASIFHRDPLWRETDWPPHHFLRFSSTALFHFLHSEGFHEIDIQVVKDFSDMVRRFECAISGALGIWNVRMRFLQKQVGMNAKTFAKSRQERRNTSSVVIFRLLQAFRNALFLPVFTVLYPFMDGTNFYFQARLEK